MEKSPESNVIWLSACPACGAEVRAGSEFCYNCGGGLTKPRKNQVPTKSFNSPVENEPIKNGPGTKPNNANVRKRTARSPYPRSNEPVKVIWQQDEGVGMSYLLLSAAAAFLVIVLIAIAYYLR